MHVEFDTKIPVRLVLDDPSIGAYEEFCLDNPDLRFERTPEGEIELMAPASGLSSNRNLKVASALDVWATQDGSGEAFDSSVQYFLPDGSGLSPDASWVSNASWCSQPEEHQRGFFRLCPEFVVEVLSPSDRLKKQQDKMERWIANGVQLGWLIDGDAETVYIYRPGVAAEVRTGITTIDGEGPIAGFTLDLTRVWRGLKK